MIDSRRLTFRDLLGSYVRDGFRLVPVPVREKGPVVKGWPSLSIDEASIPKHFPSTSNVGALLGVPPLFLVDIDLDAPEAVALAPHFLPTTPLIWGHESRPQSHWGYRVNQSVRSKKYTIKESGNPTMLM